eukprot:TRINITY_DN15181_c0_g6_i1.p1 TRINITY_DN15181_c0_g6~~TRINITY_DN15181_c0_g6_i1.p1  ORF type:complete len:211 (-),score=19.34 TRINITY_DN15181_c0_g6_i1:177-809(-)
MGNEQTRSKGLGKGMSISDEAAKAEAGFANIYTPTLNYIALLSGTKVLTPKERKKEIRHFLLNSPEMSNTKRLIHYFGLFLAGGFLGTAVSSLKEMLGRIQYFPFSKAEEFVGERRRLSLYPLKYFYQASKAPFVKGGVVLLSYGILKNLLTFLAFNILATITRGGEAISPITLLLWCSLLCRCSSNSACSILPSSSWQMSSSLVLLSNH